MIRFLSSLFNKPTQEAQPVAGHAAETSMNFDSENVRPFLEGLAPGTIDQGALAVVDSAVGAMAVDETRDIVLNAQSGLQLQIYMDDIQAPDLYFFGPVEVIQYIDSALMAFANAMGL
ncbi:hypothetical protein Q4555_05865 [Octadecabacter sp. 1_MG-2023]|uniref:hypothetical protein n=1 Tax=unclassified Octadecabacter TaxID=196158 RepID=UPI001C07F1B6|nr:MULTISPECIES: hypothetical protein [unclassified Octadecabacter]MBU2994522.1 hypothetical protein [Octadecabacter sp. B2R22]MDO6734185.1 hypothetical protein [Octadecabacter sp. 1_MG-2023]